MQVVVFRRFHGSRGSRLVNMSPSAGEEARRVAPDQKAQYPGVMDETGEESPVSFFAGEQDPDGLGERLVVRAATIDELLSESFEALRGQKGDADVAARRLAAWCRSSASGDWAQFNLRLARDGLDIAGVLGRFATVRHKPSAPMPAWVRDAIWISTALSGPIGKPGTLTADSDEPGVFEQLLMPVVDEADARLWSGIDEATRNNFSAAAHASVRHLLLRQLSDLCAPSTYALFESARKNAAAEVANPDRDLYERFVTQMKTQGFNELFDAKPVLLRLIATITRQWIDTTHELIVRLAADLPAIRDELLGCVSDSRVARIEGERSDPHNGGRSVHIVVFEDETRIVYKPKDLRVDAALHGLVGHLNEVAPPLQLRAVRTLPREGYGWSEFIDHKPCADQQGFDRYFRRAGAWLALLYCMAASDMHQENIIAAGEHPVPIDTETMFQANAQELQTQDPQSQAHYAALKIITNSVMTVGLVPAYGRSHDNQVFAFGGLVSDWNFTTAVQWDDVNTDAMKPRVGTEIHSTTPNLPYVEGHYAQFTDYIDAFTSGFRAYARFLAIQRVDETTNKLFGEFAGLPVRKVLRPTRFYSMLLQRLKDHRLMADGVVWSAQADFPARLADWEKDSDPDWPLPQAERSAMLTLDVPYFVMLTDGTEYHDTAGTTVATDVICGLDRALGRLHSLDEREIDWQVMIIRQNMESFTGVGQSRTGALVSVGADEAVDSGGRPSRDVFAAEADAIAGELSRYAIRRGTGAAWIALDWSGDSEAFQLVELGAGLYNGVSGIGLFLAAHAAVTGCAESADLARAAIAHFRGQFTGRNAARYARGVGIGGGSGLGSLIYALSVMSKHLRDDGLLADAHALVALATDDLIAADQQLDVIGGAAGAILGLLRLHRESKSADVLARATRCGEHLLRQSRVGAEGRRSWTGLGGPHDVNGMSHGAAGFAYALASLASATGRDDFANAAAECIAFENASYDPRRHTWPAIFGDGQQHWPTQWCHGAPGVGLARIGIVRLHGANATPLIADVENAVTAVQDGWSSQLLDTLCCGALGSVEFLAEAGIALGRSELCDLASRRLLNVMSAATARGDYRWSGGSRRFNPGLFRGIAGIGYTALRRIDESLPNVLLWE